MKNTFGKTYGWLLTILFVVPCLAQAQTNAIPLKQQCKMAMKEAKESGDLLNSFLEPWLKIFSSDSQMDSKSFEQARRKNFNKQYDEIRLRYFDLGGYGLEKPLNISNDLTLRTQFVVDAFQEYASNGDKEALKASWRIQNKAMREDIDLLKKLCQYKGNAG
ncbi:hypothetical protein [Klebsiella aerogenes]|uniref:hypothetical protein n=1 Tax=Klebsiella aerogenes TaxID=548 RepID=UPI002FEF17B3